MSKISKNVAFHKIAMSSNETQTLVDSIILSNYNIEIILKLFPLLLDNCQIGISRHMSGKYNINNFDNICRFLVLNSYKYPIFSEFMKYLTNLYENEQENIASATAEIENIFRCIT